MYIRCLSKQCWSFTVILVIKKKKKKTPTPTHNLSLFFSVSVQSELPSAGVKGHPPQHHAGPITQLQLTQISLKEPELHEGS